MHSRGRACPPECLPPPTGEGKEFLHKLPLHKRLLHAVALDRGLVALAQNCYNVPGAGVVESVLDSLPPVRDLGEGRGRVAKAQPGADVG